jgi:hypothetical protein
MAGPKEEKPRPSPWKIVVGPSMLSPVESGRNRRPVPSQVNGRFNGLTGGPVRCLRAV